MDWNKRSKADQDRKLSRRQRCFIQNVSFAAVLLFVSVLMLA